MQFHSIAPISDSYKATFVTNCKPHPGDPCDAVLLYRFKSLKSKITYMIRIETYPHNVYVPKFYPKNLQNSNKKYKHLTQTNEPRRIINTIINVMILIHQSNPNASFAFVGSYCDGEKQTPTGNKRWKVYSTYVSNMMGVSIFSHHELPSINAYMLINNHNIQKKSTLIDDIQIMFNQRINLSIL